MEERANKNEYIISSSSSRSSIRIIIIIVLIYCGGGCRALFEEVGLQMEELYFDDCTTPPADVVRPLPTILYYIILYYIILYL